MIHKSLLVFLLILLLAAIAMGQGWWESKSYTDWTKDEVTNLLDKSPWGNVVTKSIERVSHLRSNGETVTGTESSYDRLAFHLSFVSAKPVRMALARRALLADPGKAGQTDWSKYIEQGDDQNIVVVMSLSANPVGSTVYLTVSDTLDRLKTEDLAAQTFLATHGGKKVSLARYDPLGENGYGVKFYFPRRLPDGSPFVTDGNKEIRFETVINLPKERAPDLNIKLIQVGQKWDLRKMLYQGKPAF